MAANPQIEPIDLGRESAFGGGAVERGDVPRSSGADGRLLGSADDITTPRRTIKLLLPRHIIADD